MNKVGRNIWPGKEFKFFSRRALLKHIREFDATND
jgi:hypothetical protein